jgi:hypothetical protein
MLRAIQYVAAISAIVFGLWVFATSSSFKSCKIEQTTANTETSKEQTPPSVLTSANRAAVSTRCALHVAYEYRDLATAIATVFIALFTFTLWWSTKGMMQATRDSVRLAERALNELEIPFISLKVNDPGITIRITVNGQPVPFPSHKMEFCFANYGRTPATLTQLKTALVVKEIGKLPAAIDPNEIGKVYPFGVMVGPSDTSAPSTRFFKDFISESDKHAIEKGERDIFLIGFVKFTDIFQSKYTLGFCAKFDRKGGRFVLEGEEGYNYQAKQPAQMV